jgi:hypothetical protein
LPQKNWHPCYVTICETHSWVTPFYTCFISLECSFRRYVHNLLSYFLQGFHFIKAIFHDSFLHVCQYLL